MHLYVITFQTLPIFHLKKCLKGEFKPIFQFLCIQTYNSFCLFACNLFTSKLFIFILLILPVFCRTFSIQTRIQPFLTFLIFRHKETLTQRDVQNKQRALRYLCDEAKNKLLIVAFLLPSRVNFIDVLQPAFVRADPESAKKTDNLTLFLCFRDI